MKTAMEEFNRSSKYLEKMTTDVYKTFIPRDMKCRLIIYADSQKIESIQDDFNIRMREILILSGMILLLKTNKATKVDIEISMIHSKGQVKIPLTIFKDKITPPDKEWEDLLKSRVYSRKKEYDLITKFANNLNAYLD